MDAGSEWNEAQAVCGWNRTPAAPRRCWRALSDSDTRPTDQESDRFVHVMLGPAVVALAWPLWLRRAELRRRGVALAVAALAGGAAACASACAFGALFGMPPDLLRSLAPKSVTSPVAMGIVERIGDVPALAAVFAIVTGIVGALSAKCLFDALRIRDWAVRGFALGTAAHGIGAARALQVHPDAGAYARIAQGLQVLLATILIPLALHWFSRATRASDVKGGRTRKRHLLESFRYSRGVRPVRRWKKRQK